MTKLAASGISPARAQSSEERVNEPVAEVPATLDKSAFTLLIYFENDLFYGQDRYYTNAVQMRLISPDLSSITENNILPGGFSRALGGVPVVRLTHAEGHFRFDLDGATVRDVTPSNPHRRRGRHRS